MIFDLEHKKNETFKGKTDLLDLDILDFQRTSNSGKSLTSSEQVDSVTNCLKYLETQYFVYFIEDWYKFEKQASSIEYTHAKPRSKFAFASHQKIAGTFLAWVKSKPELKHLDIELGDKPDFVIKNKTTGLITIGDFGKVGLSTFFRIFPFLSETLGLVIVKPFGQIIYFKFNKQYDPHEVFSKWLL